MKLMFSLISGRSAEYSGEAVNPRNLSVYETLRRVGRHHVSRSQDTDHIEIVSSPSTAVSEAVKRSTAQKH